MNPQNPLNEPHQPESWNETRYQLVLLVHAAATLFMVGLIWFVQVVHYPLLSSVGSELFSDYAAAHSRLTTRVVVAPMMIELVTAVVLLRFRPAGVRSTHMGVGLALLVVIWLSTFFLQVPQHEVLLGGFAPEAYHRLVVTNWIRTVCWSARGVLVLCILKHQTDHRR